MTDLGDTIVLASIVLAAAKLTSTVVNRLMIDRSDNSKPVLTELKRFNDNSEDLVKRRPTVRFGDP